MAALPPYYGQTTTTWSSNSATSTSGYYFQAISVATRAAAEKFHALSKAFGMGLSSGARVRLALAGLARPGPARAASVKPWDGIRPLLLAAGREHRLRPGMRRRARLAHA